MSDNPDSESIARRLKLILFLCLVVPIVLLTIFIEFRVESIHDSVGLIKESLTYQEPGQRDNSRMELDTLPWHPVQGQQLYVPAYSHVYHQKGKPYLLTVTLNIRNTDVNDEIAVTSVRYFDTGGNPLRSMLDKPLKLAPLAATEFVINRDDKAGGSGASFIVEWTSGTKVTPPVVETVMIDTSSAQGLSFIAPAVVLDDTQPFDSVRSSEQE